MNSAITSTPIVEGHPADLDPEVLSLLIALMTLTHISSVISHHISSGQSKGIPDSLHALGRFLFPKLGYR